MVNQTGSTNNPPDNPSHAEADLVSRKPEANPDKLSPNISLNSHDQRKRSELIFLTILAILIQAAPLIYSGFLTQPALSRNIARRFLLSAWTHYVRFFYRSCDPFHVPVRKYHRECSKEVVWERDIRSRPRGDGQDEPAAASTTQSEPENKPIAHPAEQNGQTQEAQATPPTAGPYVVPDSRLMYPIWILKKLPSGDQSCVTFFLSSPSPRKSLITSTRNDDTMDSHWSRLLTTIAVLVGKLGFIGQLEGLRLVN